MHGSALLICAISTAFLMAFWTTVSCRLGRARMIPNIIFFEFAGLLIISPTYRTIVFTFSKYGASSSVLTYCRTSDIVKARPLSVAWFFSSIVMPLRYTDLGVSWYMPFRRLSEVPRASDRFSIMSSRVLIVCTSLDSGSISAIFCWQWTTYKA